MSIKAMTWAFELAQLPPMETLILLTLADSANEDGVAYRLDVDEIARRSKMSRRTAIKYLGVLDGMGLIFRVKHWCLNSGGRKQQGKNIYLLNVGCSLIEGSDGWVTDRKIDPNSVLGLSDIGAGGVMSARGALINDQRKCRDRGNQAKKVKELPENKEDKTAGGGVGAPRALINDQQKQVNAVEPVDKPVDKQVSWVQQGAPIDQLSQELNYPPIVPPRVEVESVVCSRVEVEPVGLVGACLPEPMRKLDERSRVEVENLLAGMVAEGYLPSEIYRVLNGFPLPPVVLNMRKLVEYRLGVAAKTLTKHEKTALEAPNSPEPYLVQGAGCESLLDDDLEPPGWLGVAFERYRSATGGLSLAECFAWAQDAERVSV